MASAPYWVNGQWNAVCDQCGREYKSSELTQRWDGLLVCREDWEPRQPQDFVRAVIDQQAVPWSRPDGDDIFVTGAQCDMWSVNAIPSEAVPGCAFPRNINALGMSR